MTNLRSGATPRKSRSRGETVPATVPLDRTPGRKKHPLYSTWNGMLQRCYNTRNPNYPRYGARGIRVCAEWRGRLQGFQWRCAPDFPGAWQDNAGRWWSPDYTLIPYRGKPAADGPRYKALGNSMAVPCMAWIGHRIALVDALRVEGECAA